MTEICSLQELRGHYGEASGLAAAKVMSRIDKHAREFIARSPFLVLCTSDADGWPDASPKGDAPGFVTVEGDRLLLPDRMGNNRVDGFSNLIANPKVGILFLVPGVDHNLRVNGAARLLVDKETCARFSVNGRPAVAVLEVTAKEVFFHCGKAAIRSNIWRPEAWPQKAGLANLGTALAEQIGGVGASEAEERVQESIRTRLY